LAGFSGLFIQACGHSELMVQEKGRSLKGLSKRRV
jgi:hypothetical protein